MASSPVAFERILRRDRQLVTAALGLTIVSAWLYLLLGAGLESGSSTATIGAHGAIPDASHGGVTQTWDATHALIVVVMWWLMMVAMMLPSAAPTILLAAALNRRADEGRKPYGETGFFVAGYLFVWLLFSVAATLCQWALETGGLLSPMMASANGYLSGALLVAAGVWQQTASKQACLRHCRSPVQYLVRHRRPGNRGALVMGMGHGTYCVGCCWALMGLLFYAGVMDLLWVAGLALYVLLEKRFMAGERVSRYAGMALMLAGVVLFVA